MLPLSTLSHPTAIESENPFDLVTSHDDDSIDRSRRAASYDFFGHIKNVNELTISKCIFVLNSFQTFLFRL